MWLLVVVLACAVFQLAFLWPMGRHLVYDEAIYLSQDYSGMPPLPFSALRARGLPWLLAPVSVFGAPVSLVRLYMLLLSSAVIFLAFHAWLPLLRKRAVLAAGAFGGGWVALFYATEILPNALVALGAVAATGYLAQHLVAPSLRNGTGRGGRRSLWTAALALGFVTLIRPTDGTFLAAGMTAATLTPRLRILLTRWIAFAVGLLAGWIPWIVEAFIRWGSVGARLHAASQHLGTGVTVKNISYHLALTDGPIEGIDRSGIPIVGVVWWLLLFTGALIALACALFRRDRVGRVAIIPALAGLTSATQYLLLTDITSAPARYLLPMYALLTVCLAAVIPAPSRLATRAVAVALLVGWLGWNMHIADQVADSQARRRETAFRLAMVLSERAHGRDCLFASRSSFPEIQFVSGCIGSRFNPSARYIWLARNPGSAEVFVPSRIPPGKSALLRRNGEVKRLDDAGLPGWWLYRPDRNVLRWRR
jgi:hypothetical protein